MDKSTAQTEDFDLFETPEEFTGVEVLLSVVDVVEKYGPKDVAEYLTRAVERLIEEGGSLDEHLGIKLKGRGSPSAMSAYYTWKRNQQLYLADGCCVGDGPTAKSRQLEKEVSIFRNVWPSLVHKDQPGENCSQLRRALFKAFQYADKCAIGIPKSHRQLFDIVREVRERAALDKTRQNRNVASEILRMKW